MADSIDRARAEHYRWGDGCDGWHLVRTAGLSVIEEAMPPGTAEVRHYHQHAEQFFYVLRGEAVLEVDGTPLAIGPGQGAHVPAGTPHRIQNASAAVVELLVVSRPPSHGDRIVLAT